MNDVQTACKLGLLPEEFDRICQILGRTPNFTELSLYSVMWSEHCSYKNSIVWLKTLPRESDKMLAKAGEENAGLMDIGEGLAVSFKIESHNHPSAIEPYQGAATGVGGINRDIFSMGARPIAQLNSLRFGELERERTRWIMRGVVKGIGDYGNAFGVPTVGGEVFFDKSYNINPLVNAMSVGIVEHGKSVRAISYGVGNPVIIYGSATGKDGIHGATFASGDLHEDSAKDLPSVQVGDPFMEKLLLEATLEAIETGAVIGLQDMGAAGIICSTSEMSAKGRHGMDIWLDKVPLRQAGMKGWEILLSESQERMLVVCQKGREQELFDIFQKWDLLYAQIGVVTEGKMLRYYHHGVLEAEVPAESLVLGGGAPVYHRQYSEPDYFQAYKKFDINSVPEPEDLTQPALFLLSHPNLASKRWVYEQYDSMVGAANASTNAPSDASVVHIHGTNKYLVLTVDCNSRYVHADPKAGCAIAVAEAARNIVCTGGTPLGITNCLNFGNPYVPEVYWQFVQAIAGMKAACEALGIPVTGGNVSFYNQSTDEGPVFPTPTIGMVGIMEGLDKRLTINFKSAGDLIYLLGKPRNCIAQSEYLYSWHKIEASPAPEFDLDYEIALHRTLNLLNSKGLLRSAHDVSDGGIWLAVCESALAGSKGFAIQTLDGMRRDVFLFGEGQSRVVVSIQAARQAEFEAEAGFDILMLGKVTDEPNFVVDGESWVSLEQARNLYEGTLAEILG